MAARPLSAPIQPGSTVLVSGAARSGKSAWAEQLARFSGLAVTYLATGPSLPNDPSWQQRLLRHRQRRPASWRTEEVGVGLPEALMRGPTAADLLLVDSLGTWLVHHLERDALAWQGQIELLLKALGLCPAAVVLVAEEVGWGVVPPTEVGGLFRDRLGELLECIEPLCSGSWLVIRGRALDLQTLGVSIHTSDHQQP